VKQLSSFFVVMILLPVFAGCGAIIDFFQPSTTSVTLINNSDFPVDVTLFIDDEQNIPEDALTEVGEQIDRTLQPGEVASFSRDCDELQAIIVEDADLRVVVGVSPETSTDVLRDGDDFGCGDRIIFTFDHSALLVDFNVTVDVQERTSL